MLKLALPIGLAAFMAVLAASNPSETAHTRALVDHAKHTCLDNRLVKEMCGGMASLASLALTYDDHLFYSNAHVGHVDTFGVLGKVFVSDDSGS